MFHRTDIDDEGPYFSQPIGFGSCHDLRDAPAAKERKVKRRPIGFKIPKAGRQK